MKVVINKCYGGFGLSAAAILRYAEIAGFKVFGYTDDHSTSYEKRMFNRVPMPIKDEDDYFLIYWLKDDLGERIDNHSLNHGCEWFHDRDIQRHDPILIQVVEEMGENADGEHAELRIVEIPDGVEYEISDYDGIEHIAEKHRVWY